jgi:hypothetical protein
VDACCGNGDCGGQLPHCTLRTVPGAQKMAFHCGKTGDLSFNQLCLPNGSEDCQSNFCLAVEVRCTSRCCKKSDCTAAGSNWGCVYVNDPTYSTPVCAPAGSTGPEPIGAPCTTHSQCQSGRCVSVIGVGDFCSDSCCRDEDCGDTAQFGCRALNSNGTGLLLCVPL